MALSSGESLAEAERRWLRNFRRTHPEMKLALRSVKEWAQKLEAAGGQIDALVDGNDGVKQRGARSIPAFVKTALDTQGGPLLSTSTISPVTRTGVVIYESSGRPGQMPITVEKADPQIVHDAPSSVTAGTLLTVTFQLVDFDGEARNDSGGTLLLDLDGTDVALPITNGRAVMPIELHASLNIRQQPPYFGDARLAPFTVEVSQ